MNQVFPFPAPTVYQVTGLFIEAVNVGAGQQHHLGHPSVVAVWRIKLPPRGPKTRWRLNQILGEGVEGGCVLNLERSFRGESFVPGVVRIEEIRGDVQVMITLLQLHHAAVWEVEADLGHTDVVSRGGASPPSRR